MCYINTQPQQQPFYGPLSGTTQVSRYQKKHSPIHHPDHHPIFISFCHLPRSTASSLFKLRAWQSFCTTSVHVLFGLHLGLEPSTSYSIHFFTQSVSSFAAHAHTIATCFTVVTHYRKTFLVTHITDKVMVGCNDKQLHINVVYLSLSPTAMIRTTYSIERCCLSNLSLICL